MSKGIKSSIGLESDMKKILSMIQEFTPENTELETKLQSFIPEYIPCIGDIDPMIKVV
jgi:intraflagellar transport protein 46